jgi:hypothetical protein
MKDKQRIYGLMNMAKAYKEGTLDTRYLPDDLMKKIKQVVGFMPDEQLEKFAKTEQRVIPNKLGKGSLRRINKVK